MLLYKDMVDGGQIPTETIRGAPLCMGQYSRIFSACRIPRPGEDELRVYSRSESRHIVVARLGQFFRVDVYSPDSDRPLATQVFQLNVNISRFSFPY